VIVEREWREIPQCSMGYLSQFVLLSFVHWFHVDIIIRLEDLNGLN